jgi:hypothetical protein
MVLVRQGRPEITNALNIDELPRPTQEYIDDLDKPVEKGDARGAEVENL